MNKLILFIIYSLFIALFVNAEDNIDANWMKYISNNLYINQINIPGTHDSGTLNIGNYRNDIFDFPIDAVISEFGQTQDLDIREQLEHGIRYLDIRITIKNKNDILYITHNGVKCLKPIHLNPSSNINTLLYLSDVFDLCISFLNKHPTETIIIHLKCDAVPEELGKDNKYKIIKEKVESYCKDIKYIFKLFNN
ncbi:PLC-like phosphodiesterase [Piromyces finnis]|uniref:PLC-like phosphodiesterase n=1 Tax=Piromyces finnis TaxID=1754191 RepID=A0A1Y1VA09_9FUNG|nr:PLC-like phosphodiesterase [Piromyces finnis]|eukprot:ORX49594.1 PLC-like phosphodiesterase [Piromyces finnis]